jgi:hypothetical protein
MFVNVWPTCLAIHLLCLFAHPEHYQGAGNVRKGTNSKIKAFTQITRIQNATILTAIKTSVTTGESIHIDVFKMMIMVTSLGKTTGFKNTTYLQHFQNARIPFNPFTYVRNPSPPDPTHNCTGSALSFHILPLSSHHCSTIHYLCLWHFCLSFSSAIVRRRMGLCVPGK